VFLARFGTIHRAQHDLYLHLGNARPAHNWKNLYAPHDRNNTQAFSLSPGPTDLCLPKGTAKAALLSTANI
jgi:hypothetical protein